MTFWGLHEPGWLHPVGKQSRDYLPDFATLNDRARAREPGRDPPFYIVVYRRPPCVPRSREREKRPAGAKEKRADIRKSLFST